MGSSCFARGNKTNLDYIENIINKGILNIKLELSGSRCEKQCAYGPNIIINGKIYHQVNLNDLKMIFSRYLVKKSRRNKKL